MGSPGQRLAHHHAGRMTLLSALIMLASLGCATFPPPGKFDGSHYLNEVAGYSFMVPGEWKAPEPPLKAGQTDEDRDSIADRHATSGHPRVTVNDSGRRVSCSTRLHWRPAVAWPVH